MQLIELIGIVVFIHTCICTADDLNMLLNIGGPNSQCNQSFELVEESDHTILFDGDSFPEKCALTFSMNKTTIKTNDQRYSVCVKRASYDVSDETITLMCYMYGDGKMKAISDNKSQHRDQTSLHQKYNGGCFTIVRDKNGEHFREVCADIGETMSVVLTNGYGLYTTPPQRFKNSHITLNVYAQWNMPAWMIIVITVSCLVGTGLGTFVIVTCCIHFANKNHKARRARFAAASTNFQWRLDGNQLNYLQGGQYATQYDAFQFNQAFQPEVKGTIY